MVCLIFSETIITVPNATCFLYRKDQQALVCSFNCSYTYPEGYWNGA